MVSDTRIAECIDDAKTAQAACDGLIKLALDGGGNDNVTAVLAPGETRGIKPRPAGRGNGATIVKWPRFLGVAHIRDQRSRLYSPLRWRFGGRRPGGVGRGGFGLGRFGFVACVVELTWRAVRGCHALPRR